VTTDPARLWHAAAVVLAPPVTAWAFGRHAGAALSDDALKVSARQLLAAPLPADAGAWDAAVGLLRRAAVAPDEKSWREALERFGRRMSRAYGVDDAAAVWWFRRLPGWR
jgi:hypothetical protein